MSVRASACLHQKEEAYHPLPASHYFSVPSSQEAGSESRSETWQTSLCFCFLNSCDHTESEKQGTPFQERFLTTETQEIESFQGESWTHGISRMFPSLLVLCCLSLTIESSHGKTIYTSTLTTHLPGFLLLPASLTPFPSFLARVICGDSQWRHVWHSPLCSGTVKRTLEKEKTLWENVFRVNRACKSSQRTPMLVFQSGFCLRDRNRRNLTFLNYPRRNPKAGSDLVNRLFSSAEVCVTAVPWGKDFFPSWVTGSAQQLAWRAT